MAMVKNFEVMLGQTLNLSVDNSMIFVMSYLSKLFNFLAVCRSVSPPLITFEPNGSNLLQHCYIV
jgi:hypothetical protein